MEITITWNDKSFNIGLASAPGKEEFLSIKGCRIANGKTGEFVSYPSTKNEKNGKYWNHVWGGEKFNAVVLSKALESHKQAQKQSSKIPKGYEDIPF